MKSEKMRSSQISQEELIRKIFFLFPLTILVLGAMFFLPAGTMAYWQAWVYIVIIIVPAALVIAYFLKNDPEILIRRMKLKEKEREQKLIIKLGYIPYLLAFLLPGFDQRFSWSQVPLVVVILAEILVVLGYGIVSLAFKANRYAARVVEVEQGQKVIDSGPYAIVRHPMYVGAMLMLISSPLALASYWAMIPAIFMFPVIVARILNEEKVLIRDLEGYSRYMQKTRYRLIPGIW